MLVSLTQIESNQSLNISLQITFLPEQLFASCMQFLWAFIHYLISFFPCRKPFVLVKWSERQNFVFVSICFSSNNVQFLPGQVNTYSCYCGFYIHYHEMMNTCQPAKVIVQFYAPRYRVDFWNNKPTGTIWTSIEAPRANPRLTLILRSAQLWWRVPNIWQGHTGSDSLLSVEGTLWCVAVQFWVSSLMWPDWLVIISSTRLVWCRVCLCVYVCVCVCVSVCVMSSDWLVIISSTRLVGSSRSTGLIWYVAIILLLSSQLSSSQLRSGATVSWLVRKLMVPSLSLWHQPLILDRLPAAHFVCH